jgi:hypothetical protein
VLPPSDHGRWAEKHRLELADLGASSEADAEQAPAAGTVEVLQVEAVAGPMANSAFD